MTRPRRLCVLLAVLLAAGTLTACGKHQSTGPVRIAETEGIYVDVGELKYQVQVSRQLNPNDVQDAGFLAGIPEDERELTRDEVWFAVLIRVQNVTKEPILPAEHIEIEDTQEDIFEPIELEASNLYAYRADEPIPAGETVPLVDAPGGDSPSRGAVLLFKLTLEALNNRPLELRLESRSAPKQTGIVDLDV